MTPVRAELERARERLRGLGPGALSLQELLQLVGVGKPLDLLRGAGGLARMARMTPAELRAVGVGPSTAAGLCAVFELGRRVAQEEAPAGVAIRSASAAFTYLQPRLGHLTTEVFVVLLLDIRLRVLRDVTVATGTGWACAVQPRDALASAVREGAAAVVFAHNHPSGDPTPSDEDRDLTRRLIAASEVLGIRAVDHVVVAARQYTSFRELGLWDDTNTRTGATHAQ